MTCVYSRGPVPREGRERLTSSRACRYQLDNTFWELEDDWTEPDGAEFNVFYRSCQEAEEEVDRRLRRHVVSLGYTTAWCFSISHSQILADPNGWFGDTADPRPVSNGLGVLGLHGRTDPSSAAESILLS